MQKRILMLDDDATLAEAFIFALSEYEIVFFSSTEEAKAELILNHDQYDLVLTDYKIVGSLIFGAEFGLWVRLNYKIKVIIMSGNFNEVRKDRNFFEATFSAQMKKPIDLNELRTVIKGVVSS